MVDHRALPVAKALGIEIYSYADAITDIELAILGRWVCPPRVFPGWLL